jgi:phenylalanyl-tRNA synthetase alpha chain
MSSDLVERIKALVEEASKSLDEAGDDAAVEAVRVRTIGRNGELPALSGRMGELPPELKREAGKAFNEAKNSILAKIEEAKGRLASKSASAAERIDVTLPGRRWPLGRKHPVNKTADEAVAIFRRMGFIAASGPELDTVWNNFDALNAPENHPSRSPQDTFYFGDGRLLRTQTSTIQIRVMSSQKPPVRIVSPGRCYRRDTPDATHGVHFHQIEGLYVDEQVSMADLKSALNTFAREFFGSNVGIRFRPHFFPFTEPSVEVDFSCVMCGGKGCRVCKGSGWLEIAGAGMVNPKVLKNVGYDPEKWQGYAFGMGIERLTMLKYRIEDLRIFSDNDLRFLEQF